MSSTFTVGVSNYTPWNCGVNTGDAAFATVPQATCSTPGAACSTYSLTLLAAAAMHINVNGTVFTLDFPAAGAPNAVQPIQLSAAPNVTLGYAVLWNTNANAYSLLLCANAISVDAPNAPEGPTSWQGQLTVTLTMNGKAVSAAADGSQYVWPVPVGAQLTFTPTFTVSSCACGASASTFAANTAYTLRGAPVTLAFPDLTASLRSGNPLAPFYIDAAYAAGNVAVTQGRLCMHALCTASASLLHISFPPWGDLGFTWAALGKPLYSGAGGAFLPDPVVPGAVFNILNAAGQALQLNPSKSTFDGFKTANPATSLQAFTFLTNSGGGFVLCVLDAGAAAGAWAIQPLPQPDGTVQVKCVPPELCTYAYGIVPLWVDAGQTATGVVVLARELQPDTTSSAAAATNHLLLLGAAGQLINNTGGVISFTPSSFIRSWCDDATVRTSGVLLQPVTACDGAVPAAFTASQCWLTSSYGCPNNAACVLQTTLAGAKTCACNSSSPLNAVAAKEFVASECMVPYTSSACAAVAGTKTSSCSGWSLPGLSEACASACTAIFEAEGNSLYCDGAAARFCAAHPHMGDCACLNVQTSSFPVAVQNGLSYPAAQAALFNEFGLSGVVQLRPECFWPTCGVDGAGIQHGPTYHAQHCPTGITLCETEIKNVFATGGTGKVTANIVQDCGANTSSLLACSSTVFDDFRKFGGPVSGPSSYQVRAAAGLKLDDYIFLGLVCGLTAVLLCVLIALLAKYASRASAKPGKPAVVPTPLTAAVVK